MWLTTRLQKTQEGASIVQKVGRGLMFLRFVSTKFDEDSQCRLGIFQTAYDLRESGRLSHYEEA